MAAISIVWRTAKIAIEAVVLIGPKVSSLLSPIRAIVPPLATTQSETLTAFGQLRRAKARPPSIAPGSMMLPAPAPRRITDSPNNRHHPARVFRLKA